MPEKTFSTVLQTVRLPHNCYTSGEALDNACTKLGYRRVHEEDFQQKYQFAADGETVTLDGGEAATIKPGYQVNSPWFEYRDGKYYRYQYGDEQIDELTGEQLTYTNIIFQLSPWENYDDHGYLNIDTISGGDAYYFLQTAHMKNVPGDGRAGMLRRNIMTKNGDEDCIAESGKNLGLHYSGFLCGCYSH